MKTVTMATNVIFAVIRIVNNSFVHDQMEYAVMAARTVLHFLDLIVSQVGLTNQYFFPLYE